MPKKVPILGVNYQWRTNVPLIDQWSVVYWTLLQLCMAMMTPSASVFLSTGVIFLVLSSASLCGWRLRRHLFDDILTQREANRCCTVMPSASLCNSCVNVFVLENGASRRYDASGVIFLAFSENAHLTSEAHCDQTRPARTLKFSRKVAQDVP